MIAIAVTTLIRGLSMIAMYLAVRTFSESLEATPSLADHHTAMLVGFGCGPVLIGTLLLVFSAHLERLLLGKSANHPIEGLGSVSSESFVTLLLRLLGVYFACSHLTGLVGTGVTVVSALSGNTFSKEVRLLGEFAAQVSGLILAGLLCFRTSVFTRLVSAR